MAHGALKMSREELVEGFAQGRQLTQEEWAHPLEHQWINELIAEGKAVVTVPWGYHDHFQCSIRKVKGIRNGKS